MLGSVSASPREQEKQPHRRVSREKSHRDRSSLLPPRKQSRHRSWGVAPSSLLCLCEERRKRTNAHTTGPLPHKRERTPRRENHAQGKTLPRKGKHKVRSTFGWFTGPAFRTTYRTLLRSSSPRVPRHPLGGVVSPFLHQKSPRLTHRKNRVSFRSRKRTMAPPCGDSPAPPLQEKTRRGNGNGNDPSAGSPTETLLRLQLPLENKVWGTSPNPAPKNETRIQTPHFPFHR